MVSPFWPATQQSEIRWASRWDTYLRMTDDQIHWFSIVNSVMIVLFLSGMVAMIMLRTLHRDIVKYNGVPGGNRSACARTPAWHCSAPTAVAAS